MSLSGGNMKSLLIILLLLGGCSTNPVAGVYLSKEQFNAVWKNAWMKGYEAGSCEISINQNKYAKAAL